MPKNKELMLALDWRMNRLIPSYIEGYGASIIYDEFKKDVEERFNNNQSIDVLSYESKGKPHKGDFEKGKISGANVFAAARLDTFLRKEGSNISIANLGDFRESNVMDLARGVYYTILPALVVQNNRERFKRNKCLLKQVIESVEGMEGKVKFPFLVKGFDVAPCSDDKGYGLKIVRRKDFCVIHDERLSGVNNYRLFNDVDEIGLPKFDNQGKRTFYATNYGLSNMFLDGDLGLGSSNGNLSYSDTNGSMVVVYNALMAALSESL